MAMPKGKPDQIIFQPLIFRGVPPRSFREGEEKDSDTRIRVGCSPASFDEDEIAGQSSSRHHTTKKP